MINWNFVDDPKMSLPMISFAKACLIDYESIYHSYKGCLSMLWIHAQYKAVIHKLIAALYLYTSESKREVDLDDNKHDSTTDKRCNNYRCIYTSSYHLARKLGCFNILIYMMLAWSICPLLANYWKRGQCACNNWVKSAIVLSWAYCLRHRADAYYAPPDFSKTE